RETQTSRAAREYSRPRSGRSSFPAPVAMRLSPPALSPPEIGGASSVQYDFQSLVLSFIQIGLLIASGIGSPLPMTRTTYQPGADGSDGVPLKTLPWSATRRITAPLCTTSMCSIGSKLRASRRIEIAPYSTLAP